MLQRNKDFAAQQSAAGTLMPSLPRALPNVKANIIGRAGWIRLMYLELNRARSL